MERPNWTAAELLAWLTDSTARFATQDDAVRAIDLACQAGNVVATGVDEEGQRKEIPADDWIDLALQHSEASGWVLSDAVVDPPMMLSRKVFREDVPIYAGGLTLADFEDNESLRGLLRGPVWKDLRFRSRGISASWPSYEAPAGGGRPPKAAWHIVEDLLREEVRRRGRPSRDNEEGWRNNSDVARWIEPILKGRGESVELETIRKRVPDLLKLVET